MATYTLTGSGTQELTASTTRLFIIVTTFPGNLKFGAATPTNYYHLGLIRPGISGFWAAPVPVEGLDTFMDLPTGTAQIGYNFAAGVTATVSENSSTALAITTVTPVTGSTVPRATLTITGTSTDVYPTSSTGLYIWADMGYAATLGGSTTYVTTLGATVASDGSWSIPVSTTYTTGHTFWNMFPFVGDSTQGSILASAATKVQLS